MYVVQRFINSQVLLIAVSKKKKRLLNDNLKLQTHEQLEKKCPIEKLIAFSVRLINLLIDLRIIRLIVRICFHFFIR